MTIMISINNDCDGHDIVLANIQLYRAKLTDDLNCSASKAMPPKGCSQPMIRCHRNTKANPFLEDTRLLR